MSDTLRSAIEALERELSACTLEAHRAIGHRLRAILAAHPEESLRWQCPKCGSSKAEQIPPFHYCQVTGHHEQMSRISRESAPAKEEWFAGDPTGGLSNLPPERNTAKPADPPAPKQWKCGGCGQQISASSVRESNKIPGYFGHVLNDGYSECGPVEEVKA